MCTLSDEFYNMDKLQYHVQFVCLVPRQDVTDVEHRLRVQEMLQYARAQQIQALSEDAPLLAHFYTRCVLCNFFCMTVQGLLMHWKTEHADAFKKHEAYNTQLLQQIVPSNPCAFCGLHFKQYHKCHIIRQIALLMVTEGFPVPVSAAGTLLCDFCGKAYTTRHGLQRHMNLYHSAEQAGQKMDPELFDAHCLISEAVLTDHIEDLLGHESIQFFLAT